MFLAPCSAGGYIDARLGAGRLRLVRWKLGRSGSLRYTNDAVLCRAVRENSVLRGRSEWKKVEWLQQGNAAETVAVCAFASGLDRRKMIARESQSPRLRCCLRTLA